METTINNYMEKFKTVLLFYVLGTVFSFVIIAIIHLNSFLFEPYFGYAHWSNIVKTAIISGAPFGIAIWAFLTYKFPASSIDIKFIGNLFKPYLIDYLIGVIFALLLIAGSQLYIYFFETDYYYATYYEVFGFSILLGIPLAIGCYTIKKI